MTTAPLARSSSLDQAARQHDRREEIDLEDALPVVELGVDGVQPGAAVALGRDAGVVDQRAEAGVLRLEALPHLADGFQRVLGIGQVDLNVVLRARLPGAVLREGVARAGDDAPAGRGEALDRGMADAARGAGQDQRLALGVGGVGHG